MKTSFSFFCLSFLLFSCTNPQQETTTDVVEQTTTLISKVDWLLGAWEATSGADKMVESWAKESETSYKGKGFFINNKDTVSAELLEIKETEAGLFYCPTVANQNDGKTIEFKLTSSTEDMLVFENPAHDFPQKISYTRHLGDSLTAEISGMVGSEHQSQQFVLHKVK